MAIIDVDFRLVELSWELRILEEHLEMIEKLIEGIKESEKEILEAKIRERRTTPCSPEWHLEHQTYEYKVEFQLPHLFRSPFLVSLYATYEAGVTEVAGLIQKGQGQALSIDDLRGAFLDRAKKYYKDVLRFDLCTDGSAWQQIRMGYEIRNAIAHTNGRIERLRPKSRKRISAWISKKIGIHQSNLDYIVIDACFLRKTFLHVRGSLEDLISRYKHWNSGDTIENSKHEAK